MFGRHGRHGGRRHHAVDLARCPGAATLDEAVAGDHLEILEVEGDEARDKAIRLGVCQGAGVECVTKLPRGPVIIKAGMQEIAVGRGLASRIRVRRDERRSPDGSL